MSRIRTIVRRAATVGGAAFLAVSLAPWSGGYQAHLPTGEGGIGDAQIECQGYGKGELTLPVIAEDGRMSGVLLDCKGLRQYKLEAMLTGCLPAESVGDVGYWFGGLYGKVFRLGGQPIGWLPETTPYGLEGTWGLGREGKGYFEATALRYSPDGRPTVVGVIYGEFRVAPKEFLGLRVSWADAKVPHKPTKGKFHDTAKQEPQPQRYADAASVPRKDGKTKYGEARGKPIEQRLGDAASVPRKGGKTKFGEARGEPIEEYYGDAASLPRKGGKTEFGEARDKTIEQRLGDAATFPRKTGKSRYRDAAFDPVVRRAGPFYLRFRFDE